MEGHSEKYFGEYRNFWWNKGFLDLMARRLELSRFQRMLDVGCGQLHWSKLLVPYLAKPAYVTGVDDDPKWVNTDPENIFYFQQQQASLEMVQSNAQQLPFADNSFDFVTCQTLLIHVANPQRTIDEMYRVLKPGGLFLCAEPNNLVQSLIRSSLSAQDSIEAMLDHVKYALIIERGKKRLGQGDNSVGDLVPGYLAQTGFRHIEVRLSDKAVAMYPPYTQQEQQAAMQQWRKGSSWEGPGHDELDYFKAFGDTYLDFYEDYHAKYQRRGEELHDALEGHQYHSAGGSLMYLVSGMK